MQVTSFTPITKTGEVLQEVMKTAASVGNPDIWPRHTLVTPLEQEEGIVTPLLEAAGVNPSGVLTRVKELVAGYPSASRVDMANPWFNRDTVNVLNAAEGLAGGLGDEYVSMEILPIGVATGQSGAVTVLQSAGAAAEALEGVLTSMRGSGKVTTENLKEQYQVLEKYVMDLTTRAREGKIDPVIDCDAEIRRVVQVLSCRTKNNPVPAGEPGVGKTAIVEGLARCIVVGDVPEFLKGKTLTNLDPGSMVAGVKYRGELEGRLKAVLDEIKESDGQIITSIDEIHTIAGVGATGDSPMDAGNMTKPILIRDELRLVGATTLDEYRKYIEKDAVLECRFQQVFVDEPSVEDAIGILCGLRERYEVHRGVRIQDSVLVAAVTLLDRYITSRFLPDRAIDLVDETASRLCMEIDSSPEEIDSAECIVRRLEVEEMALEKEVDITSKERLGKLREEPADECEKLDVLRIRQQSEKSSADDIRPVREELDALHTEPEKAEREGDCGRIAELRYGCIPELGKKLEAAEESAADAEENSMFKEEITSQEAVEVVSAWTGIPAGRVVQGETERLLEMELNLGRRVVGQNAAVEAVSNAARRSRAGVADPNRPTSSFLFLGPTGVDKTELARALAEPLFDDEHAMACIDMSEYGEKHSVACLIGALLGYVGRDAGGQLTEAVRRRSYTVVLLDEVEKTHPDASDMFLQVFDEGRLIDGQGRTVGFRNTIPILTSSPGAGGTHEQIADAVKMALKPEFIDRLNDVVIFDPLTSEQPRGTVDIQVHNLIERLEARRLVLDIVDGALDWLLERDYDPAYDAHPLRRLVQKAIGDELARRPPAGDVRDGDYVEVTVADDDGSLKVVGYDEGGVARV